MANLLGRIGGATSAAPPVLAVPVGAAASGARRGESGFEARAKALAAEKLARVEERRAEERKKTLEAEKKTLEAETRRRERAAEEKAAKRRRTTPSREDDRASEKETGPPSAQKETAVRVPRVAPEEENAEDPGESEDEEEAGGGAGKAAAVVVDDDDESSDESSGGESDSSDSSSSSGAAPGPKKRGRPSARPGGVVEGGDPLLPRLRKKPAVEGESPLAGYPTEFAQGFYFYAKDLYLQSLCRLDERGAFTKVIDDTWKRFSAEAELHFEDCDARGKFKSGTKQKHLRSKVAVARYLQRKYPDENLYLAITGKAYDPKTDG